MKNEGETTLTVVDKLNGCVEQENKLDFDFKVFVQKVKDKKDGCKEMTMQEAKQFLKYNSEQNKKKMKKRYSSVQPRILK